MVKRRRKFAEGIATNKIVDPKYAFMPLVMSSGSNVSEYKWPLHGFGKPLQWEHVVDKLVTGLANYWYYDWSYWGNKDDSHYIPMAWREADVNAWKYNDGRPVLITNEPERVDQANRTPEQVAQSIYRTKHGFAQMPPWSGEIWACGCQVHQIDYMLNVVDAYEKAYGESYPCTGWHIHVYNNNGNWSSDIHDKRHVVEQVDHIENARDKLYRRGVLGKGFVISEYGALSGIWQHKYAMLLDTMCEYEERFLALNYIQSWAWFSSYTTSFSSSNLVISPGPLTILGQQWREIVLSSEQ